MQLVADPVRPRGRSVLTWLVVAAAALAAMVARAPGAAAAERVDVPIKQLVLPDGGIRYSVPVAVGDQRPFDALLDTGSFGLRVLKTGVQPDSYRPTDVPVSHAFASGVRFSGVLAHATLSLDGARTEHPVPIQVIDRIECVERRPNCAAAKVPPEQFRMAGGGYEGQGFTGILGVSMRQGQAGKDAENPLAAVGDGSWIIVLPRPQDPSPGHLIINPSPDDKAGFALVQLRRQAGGSSRADAATDDDESGRPGGEGWMDGVLDGCLVDETTRQRLCGKTLLDTGAQGFSVDSDEADGRSVWRAGTPARLEIDTGGQPVAVPFVAGREPSNRVRVHPPRNPEIMRISAGNLPYLFYEILYDAKAGSIGFKPRPGLQR